MAGAEGGLAPLWGGVSPLRSASGARRVRVVEGLDLRVGAAGGAGERILSSRRIRVWRVVVTVSATTTTLRAAPNAARSTLPK